MARQLYVYYRVAEAALPATVAAVQRVQATLMSAHPGLQARVLRRPELRDGEVTLMEVYAGLLPPAAETLIAQATSALPQPRHSERFDTLHE